MTTDDEMMSSPLHVSGGAAIPQPAQPNRHIKKLLVADFGLVGVASDGIVFVIKDTKGPWQELPALPQPGDEQSAPSNELVLMQAERDALASQLADVVAENRAVRLALEYAGHQFSFYAGEHEKKGTKDGNEKAETNRKFEKMCRDALSFRAQNTAKTD